MRLIDADKLEIRKLAEFNDEYGDAVPVLGVMAEDIDNAPTVDAIVLPVKVGQTVWLIEEGDEATTPFTLEVYVTAIGYDIGGFWLTMNLPLGIKHSAYVGETFFGKTVFLTREDAEAALKARENNA